MLKQKTFLLKIAILFLPLLLMASTYFVWDPFMVLKQYNRYDMADTYLNESYVGWKTYSTYKDSLKYDSFILGNSCTMGIHTQDWEKHLNGGKAIRFFDNLERLGGVANKLEVLDKDGATIKNIIIALDPSALQHHSPNTTFMHILPPETSEMSNFQFQLKMLQGYLSPNVMVPYLYYKITGEITPYMEKNCIITKHKLREAYTNNGFHPMGQTMKEQGDKFWDSEEWLRFDKMSKEVSYSRQYIFNDQIKELLKIKQISDKHRADLKFIINPQYHDYVKLNVEDLKTMQDIFGKNVVFDLTGDEEFVGNKYDYYDYSHYRPQLGVQILKHIYCDSTTIINQ